MAVSVGFRQYVQEQLEQVTSIALRSMFGGVGIYSQGFFFALMDDDTLFFKVDEINRSDYEARGMGAFRPFGDDRMILEYYELPAEVLEDAELLRSWVGKSVMAAMRKSARKRSRRRVRDQATAPGRKPAARKARAAAATGKTMSRRKGSSGGGAARMSRSRKTRRGGKAGRRR